MAALTSSAALKTAVAPSFGAQISNKSFQKACRLPSVVKVARVVASAKQGGAEISEVKSAVVSAWKNVLGGKRNVEAAAVVAMNVLMAMPALAEEEKGAIFDFNLTLPIIGVQFLLLMVALDNVWFKPVSEVMDSRDENIRKKLLSVRDNSDEIKALQNEAEGLIKAARAETAAESSKVKKALAAELDAKLQAYRASIEKELDAALANLETQKVETLKSLDAQVQALSDEIIAKLIPFKI